jgi:hypothetical protein
MVYIIDMMNESKGVNEMMKFETTGNDKVDRLVGAEVQTYEVDSIEDAVEQLRSDVAATWGDEAAQEVDASMLEAVAHAGGRMYMNVATGNVDTYDGWYYEDENGETVNAVERGEVVEVVWDADTESWAEQDKEMNMDKPAQRFVITNPIYARATEIVTLAEITAQLKEWGDDKTILEQRGDVLYDNAGETVGYTVESEIGQEWLEL